VTELLFGADRVVCEWVQADLGVVIAPPYAAIGVVGDGKLRGGVVFTRWNGANIDVTFAGRRCFSRSNIRRVYRYLFVQEKALRATAITRRSNHQMRDILPRLGFKHEGVMRFYFGPTNRDDGFVYGLLLPNARKWL
jgi:RimJ/RimL family protein N-acetyltransferase